MKIKNLNSIQTQISIYLIYIVQGFALIILAQTIVSLTHIWQTNLAGATSVVSAIGIGKLIAYPLLGELADHISRKRLLFSAICTYACFFAFIPLTMAVWQGMILTTLAGIANAELDAVAYPTLLQVHHGKSSGNVLIKAMISLGEGVLPIIILLLDDRRLWFGWAFWSAISLLIGATISLWYSKIPNHLMDATHEQMPATSTNNNEHWYLMNAIFLSYGFFAMWLMVHFTQWVTQYFETIGHYSSMHAHLLMTSYSIGSVIGVITVFLLTNRQVLSEKLLLIVMNLVSFFSLIIILVDQNQSSMIVTIGVTLFGISAAGGALQLGIGQYIAQKPAASGRLTGWYFFSSSLAIFIMPLITGHFAENNLQQVMQSLIFVALINVVLILVYLWVSRETNLKKDGGQ
ncbi:MFS transporter [Weissella paramesenteroides]